MQKIIEAHILLFIIVDIVLLILSSFQPDTSFIQYLILYLFLIGFVTLAVVRYLNRREYDYSNLEKWK
jgi:uncharacterized membrane-anchored protein